MGNKQILPQEKPGFSRLSGRGNRAENFLSQGAFPRLPTGGKYGTLSLVDTSLTKSPGPSTRPGEKHGCRGGPALAPSLERSKPWSIQETSATLSFGWAAATAAWPCLRTSSPSPGGCLTTPTSFWTRKPLCWTRWTPPSRCNSSRTCGPRWGTSPWITSSSTTWSPTTAPPLRCCCPTIPT